MKACNESAQETLRMDREDGLFCLEVSQHMIPFLDNHYISVFFSMNNKIFNICSVGVILI